VDKNGNNIFIVVGKNGVINNSPADAQGLLASPETLQIGDVISQLPADSKIVTINGEQLYETPDNVYLRQKDNDGVVQYEVVGK
jgi:hypothetical protein